MNNWNGKPYHSLDYMLRERFGEKVYKVTLNGGKSCPNRDGIIGHGGCIFCSEGGSGDFAASAALSINTSDGIPTFSIVYVSAAFICAPLGRYLIDLTAFIMLFKWERPQFPAGFCLQVSIFSVRLLAD